MINLFSEYGRSNFDIFVYTTFSDFIEVEVISTNDYNDASKLVNYIYDSIKYGDCAPGDPCYRDPDYNYMFNATDTSGEDIFNDHPIDLNDKDIEEIAKRLKGSWQYIHSLVDDDEI